MFNNARITVLEIGIGNLSEDVDEIDDAAALDRARIEDLEVDLETYRLAGVAVAEGSLIHNDLIGVLYQRICALEERVAALSDAKDPNIYAGSAGRAAY